MKRLGRGCQTAVHVIHGHEQRAPFAPKVAKVDLLHLAKRCKRPVERQRQQVCGDDAHNARMHLVGACCAPCAAKQRSREAIGVLLGKVGEQRFGVAFARLLVHAHHRRHVPFAIGQRLEHIDDVAGNVVGRRARPERVVAHVRTREQRAGDRDDVLRKRATFAPANVVKRVAKYAYEYAEPDTGAIAANSA